MIKYQSEDNSRDSKTINLQDVCTVADVASITMIYEPIAATVDPIVITEIVFYPV